mmetsp:Transcript_80590/g.246295  ORF Transcript_80590/g.246295 Transcript_80590/m.246295 type:complete len:240 (+) Transcript_80590:345-1064(+)
MGVAWRSDKRASEMMSRNRGRLGDLDLRRRVSSQRLNELFGAQDFPAHAHNPVPRADLGGLLLDSPVDDGSDETPPSILRGGELDPQGFAALIKLDGVGRRALDTHLDPGLLAERIEQAVHRAGGAVDVRDVVTLADVHVRRCGGVVLGDQRARVARQEIDVQRVGVQRVETPTEGLIRTALEDHVELLWRLALLRLRRRSRHRRRSRWRLDFRGVHAGRLPLRRELDLCLTYRGSLPP